MRYLRLDAEASALQPQASYATRIRGYHRSSVCEVFPFASGIDCIAEVLRPQQHARNGYSVSPPPHAVWGHKAHPQRSSYGYPTSTWAPVLGPLWDHTLCAVVNDLRVYNVSHGHNLLPTADDQRKRVTAIYWGLSGAGVDDQQMQAWESNGRVGKTTPSAEPKGSRCD